MTTAKLAYSAELQAVVAAANVALQLRQQGGAEPATTTTMTTGLLSFPLSLSGVLPAPQLVCCSLGARDGVLVFNDLVLGGWLAAVAKYIIERSKVGQYRGELASVALWALAEPMTFAVNRLYRAAVRMLHSSSRHALASNA